MKNVLMKFAGFFVEKVETEPPAEMGPQRPGGNQPHPHLLHGHFSTPSGTRAEPRGPEELATPLTRGPLNVALRAWVPQDHARHLAQYGLHVVAAGGEVTSEQARNYGAQALVISAECLGSNTHFLTNPQLPTVFVSSSPILAPPRPGVVYAADPLRASEMVAAVHEAYEAWVEATGKAP